MLGEKGNNLLRHLNYSEMIHNSSLERAAPAKSRAKKHFTSLPRVDDGMRHSVRPNLRFKEELVQEEAVITARCRRRSAADWPLSVALMKVCNGRGKRCDVGKVGADTDNTSNIVLLK